MSKLILAVDTALSACSVAIVRGSETLISRVEPMARGQAERLAPLASELMNEVGSRFDQIDVIAVTRGPGAFTGLRVGLSFARGLALALTRPCIGISTLEVLAAGALQQKTLAVIEVAGSSFVGAWEGTTQIIAPCRAQDLAHLVDGLHGTWTITGPGASVVAALRPNWPRVDQSLPDPFVLACLAENADPATHLPVPLYLRGVEAKLAGGMLLPDATT